MNQTLPQLTSSGFELDRSPSKFGFLRPSSDALDDVPELNRRLTEDGYLYIPGFFEREDILEARRSLLGGLAERGFLDQVAPLMEGRVKENVRIAFEPEVAQQNPHTRSIVFGSELQGFYESLFGESILHFSYIWLRTISRGLGTVPHCDMVYMGRGTHNLLTCWIPYGDVSLELGGLMVLENSHKKADKLANYLSHDVDAYCENRPADVKKIKEEGGWSHSGALSKNPVTLQEKLGGRWLTAEFRAGDFLTFGMNTVHASLDNHTDCVRLSSDTRYQRASEPADERWIGENPIGHSVAGKRGRIC